MPLRHSRRIKRTSLQVFAPAFAIFVISCGPSTPSQRSDGLADLRASSERYVEAMRANDWPRVASFFTSDAVRMPPNQPPQFGRDAILQSFSGIDRVSDYSISIEQIDGSPGLAYVRVSYSITFTPTGTGDAISDTGKAVEVWQRDVDGEWRMTTAIWNSSEPLPR